MPEWILVPCLVQLRTEFNLLAPGRDKASDGSIGNTAHAGTVSDHNPDETGSVPIRDADRTNEVHAIDVTADLRTPGLTMETAVQFLLGRCRSGAERRLRYIIFNRRIWEASNGWRQRAYAGASPHTEHGHFSASYDTDREASTASWHLEDIPMSLTADDKKWIEGVIEAKANAAVARLGAQLAPLLSPEIDKNPIWRVTFVDPYDTSATPRKLTTGAIQKYGTSRGAVLDVGKAVVASTAVLKSAIDEVKSLILPPGK